LLSSLRASFEELINRFVSNLVQRVNNEVWENLLVISFHISSLQSLYLHEAKTGLSHTTLRIEAHNLCTETYNFTY
jgi:hypothetical protein